MWIDLINDGWLVMTGDKLIQLLASGNFAREEWDMPKLSQNGGYAEIGWNWCLTKNGEDHDKPLDLGLWDALGFSIFRQTCKVLSMHRNNFWWKNICSGNLRCGEWCVCRWFTHWTRPASSMFHGYVVLPEGKTNDVPWWSLWEMANL